ncbi:MAG: DUF1566 domain-containing protein [Nitrospinaceae bacterium]
MKLLTTSTPNPNKPPPRNRSSWFRSNRFNPGGFLRCLAVCSVVLILCLLPGSLGAEPIKHSADNRFIDNGDQTITDTKTGLMWMKEDSYIHTGHWLSWYESFDYVRNLNEEGFANYYDWQVPTVDELTTLYEPEKFNSQQVGREMNLHMDPLFAPKGSGSLWAAEPNGNYNAFGVVFNTGRRFSSSKHSKSRRATRAVRIPRPSHKTPSIHQDP